MNWKKIGEDAFRDLNKNEVRILFIRHGEHKENITDHADEDRLYRQGQLLYEAGIEVSGAISSPADRAISAVYFTKAGIGSGGYTTTDARLADMKAEDPELVKQLKAEAKAAGVEAEAHIFTLCGEDTNFRAMMQRRGKEGATAFREFAQNFMGKTILSASHGGSRMEVVIAALKNQIDETLDSGPEVLIERGQIVEIILDIHGNVLEVNYLEPLNRNA